MLADTHLRADLSALPSAVWAQVDACDAVPHAGDVVTTHLLDALRARRPVHAVLGNNDRDLSGALPERLELTLAGVRVAMVHDSGPRAGRAHRMRRWFPEAQVVVFGHSHMPVDLEASTASACSTPGRPCSGAANPAARSACSSWPPAGSSATRSSRCADGPRCAQPDSDPP